MAFSRSVFVLLSATLALPLLSLDTSAQEHADAPAAKAPAATSAATSAEDTGKPEPRAPLPPDASVEQTVTVNGKLLRYTATVGVIPTYNRVEGAKAETKSGEVVVTSYTLDGAGGKGSAAGSVERPVTFAMNGGPGASSVYLNFGAIGPRHMEFAVQGNSPSDPIKLSDNPGTWLPFSDLVFIDPIGTGFSRSLVAPDETKKLFYSTTPDIEYLSRVIYDWLVKNGRLPSRKYLIGESYGGYRGPRITHYLQSQLGVAMNGVVLVSPYINPWIEGNGDISPLPWMMTLPSIAAAHLEREHQLDAEHMAPVVAYTRGEYVTDLLAGRSNPEATPRLIKKVTDMTGLDPMFVKYSGGRLDTGAYLREVHRERGEIGSVYDSNVTAPDPYPYSPEGKGNDPILEAIIAPTTSAMVDWVTRTVGWKTTAGYQALSYTVNREWDRDKALERGAGGDLRKAVAADPKLRVLIAHGWDDLSCPFMGSVLTVDEMAMPGDSGRVAVHEYPGGHMFYTRAASQAAFVKDVEAMVAAH